MTCLRAGGMDPGEPAYASEIDAFRFGEHGSYLHAPRYAQFGQPVPIVAGRYHLYAGWTSVASHHAAILRMLLGLQDAVSLSYVDSLRDGRGWAFRSRTGADPINGFTLLREAYEVSDPDFDGEAQVPLLWDRRTATVASDDAPTIVAALFDGARSSGLATGPVVDAEVARLESAFIGELNAVAALREPSRRSRLRQALVEVDRRLAGQPYVAGDRLSDADVRLWVRLARYDAGPNASSAIGPRLDQYRHLWRWASALYDLPAFHANTDFGRFAAPFAGLPPWAAQPAASSIAG
jgi:putative glutathione S-transferase